MAEGKAKKMWALPGAQLTAPASLLMHGGDPANLLDLPCPSFLIEHPKGLVLFDTGCNPKIIDDAVGYWGEVAAQRPKAPSTWIHAPAARASGQMAAAGSKA